MPGGALPTHCDSLGSLLSTTSGSRLTARPLAGTRSRRRTTWRRVTWRWRCPARCVHELTVRLWQEWEQWHTEHLERRLSRHLQCPGGTHPCQPTEWSSFFPPCVSLPCSRPLHPQPPPLSLVWTSEEPLRARPRPKPPANPHIYRWDGRQWRGAESTLPCAPRLLNPASLPSPRSPPRILPLPGSPRPIARTLLVELFETA